MANTDDTNWDESSPSLTQARRAGALEITSLRKAVGLRMAKEHVDPAAASVGGEHLEGSARVYYASSAPTLRPDGVTPLDADDKGRIWVDSTNKVVSTWSGSAWILQQSNAASAEAFAASPFTLPLTVSVPTGTYIVMVYGVCTVAGTISVTISGQSRTIYGVGLGSMITIPVKVGPTASLSVTAASGCNVQGIQYTRVN